MTIEVTETPAAIVEVQQFAPETVEVVQSEPMRIEVVAYISQPQVGGMFVEHLGNDNWTIWFEDGK